MTDRTLERRIEELFAEEHTRAVPGVLRERVVAIPETHASPDRAMGSRRAMLLLAAALLVSVLLVAGALGSGAFRGVVPWVSSYADPATVDVCPVLERAIVRLRTSGPQPSGLSRFDHGGVPVAWGARVCAHGWDGGWTDPHLLLMPEITPYATAAGLLDSVFVVERGSSEWRPAAMGVWVTTAVDRSSPFSAVAVSAEPYFFVVTKRDPTEARSLAEAVRLELLSTGG